MLAIDVGLPTDIAAHPLIKSFPTGARLLWNKLNPFEPTLPLPNILSILARSALLGSVEGTRLVRQLCED